MLPRATSLQQTTGIVLAGGRSTRFGRDKLRERYRGTTLLEHTVRRVAEVCSEVVVVLAPAAPEPELQAEVAVRFARDPREGEGPLVGLEAGLSACSREFAVVVAGDMPELVPAVLGEMLRAASPGVEAVVLQDGDRFRPLPVVLRAGRALVGARALIGAERRRLRDLLEGLATTVIDEQTWTALDPERRTLLDVDEPGDVRKNARPTTQTDL